MRGAVSCLAFLSVTQVAECFVLPQSARSIHIASKNRVIKRYSASEKDLNPNNEISNLQENDRRLNKAPIGIQGLLWILGEGGPTGVWDVVPYAGAALYFGWRGKKAYKAFQIRQDELVEEFGRSVSAATMKQNRRPYYDTLYAIYRRKLVYRKKEPMLCAALKYVCKQPLTVQRLVALREFVDACRIKDPALIFDKAGLEYISKTNERGKLLFYARRLGIAPPELEAKILGGLINNPEALAVTQKVLAETAFRESLKLQKAEPGAYLADPEAASELGISDDDAQSILDELNTPVEVLEEEARQADKEDWLKELEEKVTEESGPVEMASDNPTPAYEDDSAQAEESQKMVRAECGDCGYTLFIAKGREWKFFGDSYTCANCGAPRSRFTIQDMADDDDDETQDSSTTSFLVDDPVDDATPPMDEVPEQPKAEEPVTEKQPIVEEPKAEEPAVEEQKAEETIAEEEPIVEEPKVEEPAVEEPKAEESVAEEEPIVEEPKAEEPVVEEPKAEEPLVEEPKAEEPVAEEEPIVEEPKAEEPEVEQTAAQEEPVPESKPEEPAPEDPAAQKAPIEDEISLIIEEEDSSEVESTTEKVEETKDDLSVVDEFTRKS